MRNFLAGNVISLDRTLAAAFIALFVLIAALCCASIFSLNAVDVQRSQLTQRYARSLTLAKDIIVQQGIEDNLALRFTLDNDSALYHSMTIARTNFEEMLGKLQTIDGSTETARQLRAIRGVKRDLITMTEPLLQLRLQGASTERVFGLMQTRGNPSDMILNRLLVDLFDRELASLSQVRDGVDQSVARLIRQQIAGSLAVGLVFVAVVVLLVRVTSLKRQHESDLRRLFEQEKKTAEARKLVLETVSHDLKSPLSAIDLSLQFAHRQIAVNNPAKVSAAMTTGLRAVNAMKDFIQTLLDQAKMDAGTFPLALESHSVIELLEEARQLLDPLAREKSITVTMAFTDPIPMLNFDQRQMLRVVSNILANAIKFTPRGGRIEMSAEHAGACVRVSVSDSGPGIAREELDRIFERFWQARATQAQGTGLGLAISRSVVEAHGGKIWAEGAPGGGARIQFELPKGAGVECLA